MLLNELKRSSAEYGVGIENGATRERESLKQLIESSSKLDERVTTERPGQGVHDWLGRKSGRT
jgi:hypothetical protein